MSNNSGLIKFLNHNRDSYEECVSLACHQNASYVNRIALFSPVMLLPSPINDQSLATSADLWHFICVIFLLLSLIAIEMSRHLFPLLTRYEIPRDSTTFYVPWSRSYALRKTCRSLPCNSRCLKVDSKLKDWNAESKSVKFYCIYLDLSIHFVAHAMFDILGKREII